MQWIVAISIVDERRIQSTLGENEKKALKKSHSIFGGADFRVWL
jgi:hypothetical protein